MFLFQQVFIFLVFLFPVASYLALLASVNRRDHPAVITGVWDSVGLLFASSGFFLLAGPAMLLAFYQQGEHALLLQPEASVWHDLWQQWWLLWVAYYGLMLLFTLGLFLVRRHSLVVYNIEPDVFDNALAQTCERLGVAWAKQGKRVYFQRQVNGSDPQLGDLTSVRTATAVLPTRTSSDLVMHVEAFPTLFNITLSWTGPDSDLRDEFQSELRKVLATVWTRQNPCAGWFLTVSGILFGLMVMTVLFMMVVVMFV